MMRHLKHTPSLLVTGTFLAGVGTLIAMDLFGSDRIAAIFDKITASFNRSVDLSELEKARGFSFFTHVPLPEAGIVVTTGVEFPTYHELLAGQESHRWCYTMLGRDGQIPRQVSLARQKRGEAPTYTDPSGFSSDELAGFGIDAQKLSRIARSACRLKGGGNGGTGGGEIRGGRERVALGEVR